MSSLPRTQTVAVERLTPAVRLRDYSELIKLRVTSLIVLSAWAGAYFAAFKTSLGALSWPVLHALIGIALIASGSAALNEVMERDLDGRMLTPAPKFQSPTGRANATPPVVPSPVPMS